MDYNNVQNVTDKQLQYDCHTDNGVTCETNIVWSLYSKYGFK